MATSMFSSQSEFCYHQFLDAMAAKSRGSPAEVVPGTPGIREVRPEHSADSFGFSPQVGLGQGGDPNPGIRKLSLRAEIDTSPPFGSVKEAVTRFGGSGPWVPFYKLADNCELDIKKVEEQATELEKDLIVKELETLDILEELSTTKRIVEELKRQLQKEALRCMKTPAELPSDIKQMNNEEENHEQIMRGSGPSSDLILMELKQAKMNLGKTINELGVIQASVESLNKKMKKEKDLLGKILESKEANGGFSRRDLEMKPKCGEIKIKMVDQGKKNSGEEQSKPCIRTAEMRLIAAKKMEEAARAAEALAMAEIKSLSSNNPDDFYGFFVPEPEPSPRTPRIPMAEDVQSKQVLHPIHRFSEPNVSAFSISMKLEEATQEVKQSKMALEEALSRVEIANRKQIAAEEALRKWIPDQEQSPLNPNSFHPSDHLHHRRQHRSPLHALMNPNSIINEPKPVLRPTVSMRDVLSKKQVTPEECVIRRQSEGQDGRQKVALSQILHEVREDLAFPPKRERDNEEQRQPQFYAQRTERRKFGFIHISLPLAKAGKKKPQVLNKHSITSVK